MSHKDLIVFAMVALSITGCSDTPRSVAERAIGYIESGNIDGYKQLLNHERWLVNEAATAYVDVGFSFDHKKVVGATCNGIAKLSLVEELVTDGIKVNGQITCKSGKEIKGFSFIVATNPKTGRLEIY